MLQVVSCRITFIYSACSDDDKIYVLHDWGVQVDVIHVGWAW